MDIRLAWRRSSNAPIRSIGCYRLDLVALLAEGYVRKEDRRPGHVRLKFFHTAGDIYIQVRGGGASRIYVGTFSDG
jgi:hypothetical protein